MAKKQRITKQNVHDNTISNRPAQSYKGVQADMATTAAQIEALANDLYGYVAKRQYHNAARASKHLNVLCERQGQYLLDLAALTLTKPVAAKPVEPSEPVIRSIKAPVRAKRWSGSPRNSKLTARERLNAKFR